MSSFLFYSSPPPSRQTHYQISPTSFFTPRVHGSRILGWPQSFSPASSSPPPAAAAAAALLTSTNANILRSPMKATKHVRFEDENSHADEEPDAMQEDQLYATTAPTTQEKPDTFTTLPVQQISTSFQSLPPLLVSQRPAEQPSQHHQQQEPRFRFQQRSRDMCSPALLSATITNARSTRQSGSRFLDRLRQSRHDRRDRRGAEAVEQIDFFQEKRSRAAYFEQEALEEVDLGEFENDDGEGEVAEDAHMSPAEDKEVEELVRRYYEPELEPEPEDNRYSATDTGTGMGMDMGTGRLGGEQSRDLWQGDEDLEYDRAFMELLSQKDNEVFQTGVSAGYPDVEGRITEISAPDRDMDMS